MELFKQISVDWLGLAGAAGYYMRGGLKYGIDFTGGTIILMKFKEKPDLNLIRESLSPETSSPPLIQRYDAPSKNTVQVRIQSSFDEGQDLEAGRSRLLTVLRKVFDPKNVDSKLSDFNNVGTRGAWKSSGTTGILPRL